MERKAVQPALRIFDRTEHRCPGERFVVCGIVVGLQARLDEFALRLGEELSGLGIVMYEPVGE